MALSSSSSDEATYTIETMTNDSQYVVGEQKKKLQRGAIIKATLTRVCKSGVRIPVEFSVIYTILDGPYYSIKSYVAFLGRGNIN